MVNAQLSAAMALALVCGLGGCQQEPAGSQPVAVASEQLTLAAPPLPEPPRPPVPTNETPSYSKNPVEALDWWSGAMEARNWSAVRAFWGHDGERSGLDEAAFSVKWSVLKAPSVKIGKGDQEGAAGSLYYTAPITIMDSGRTIEGKVTIRRVNDVDGATTEQLRWHIESLTLPL